jgi:hypothetical protein
MLEMAESSKREAEFIRHLIKVGDWMQLRLMAEHLERDAQAYRAFACPRLFPAPATDEQVRLYVNEECLTPEGIAAPQTN